QVGNYDYHFTGIAKDNVLSAEQDAELVKVIHSFRRVGQKDLPPDFVRRIYYKRLKPGETFSTLAKELPNAQHAEPWLRLLNGYYPRGEAEPGMWIKMFE
ncbi:MAG: hypothetical protein AAF197_11610, partial [Pseudomonadota bacterium]